MALSFVSGQLNKWCASMISNPLLRSVADSMRIFGPIDQFGFLRALAGVIAANCDFGRSKNGPPDAVIVIFLTRFELNFWRPWVSRSLSTAWCSESSGRIGVLFVRARATRTLPSRIIDSLFARASGFLCLSASFEAARPWAPEMPLITRSTFGLLISFSSFCFALAGAYFEVRSVLGALVCDFVSFASCLLRSFLLEWQTRPYTLNLRLCFLRT